VHIGKAGQIGPLFAAAGACAQDEALCAVYENARSYAYALQKRIIFQGIYPAATGERRLTAVGGKSAGVKDGVDRLRSRINEGRVVLEGVTRSKEPGMRHLIQSDLGLQRASIISLHLDVNSLSLYQIAKEMASPVIGSALTVGRSKDH